jgi:peptide methionine sulfoxide reductase MsrB
VEKILPEDVYEVSRNADTERPLQENIGTPMYYCWEINFCSSGAKFSNCGWPSFEQDSKSSVVYKTDNSLGMEEIEAFAEDAMGIGHL